MPSQRGRRGVATLRDVTEDDLPVLFEHQRDPGANRMAAFPARDREAFMSHWAKILADEALIKKTIVVGGQVAGNVVCFELSPGEPEVGYWIGRGFWGRGIATEALSMFLDDVTVRPLYAHVAKQNVASLRVLEKCGFRVSRDDDGWTNSGGVRVEGVLLRLEADAPRVTVVLSRRERRSAG